MTNPEEDLNKKTPVRQPVVRRSIGILLVFIAGFWLGSFFNQATGQRSNSLVETISRLAGQSSELDVFEKVWNSIKQDYAYQPVENAQLIEGAIAGMVNNLDDPYSIYLNKQSTQEFLNEIQGNFEGIGAEVGIKNGQLVIIAPLSDSPAEQAGLKAGDAILEIDGQIAQYLTLDQAVDLLRGAKETKVEILAKQGEQESRLVTVTRQEIKVDSTKMERRDLPEPDQGEYIYIKISNFSEKTADEIQAFINEIVLETPRGVVLDLRNNPGGYLQSAIDVSSLFLEDNEIILYEERGDERVAYRADGRHELSQYAMAILVNNGTASAAEIVAGALHDNHQAIIVGQTTFGKGTVQDFIELNNGASFKLTVAKWLTPDEISISEQGISPDIEVVNTADDYNNDRDPQLDEAIKRLLEQ
ncbi:MAG: S41 family peptidase [bacterium]